MCERCGNRFELPAAVRQKYPSWTPRTCMECRDSRGNGRAAKGAPGRSPERRGTVPGGELTPAQVLERFTDGPATGVFTDGSCSGNPGPGGWGAVRVVDGQIVAERFGHDPATTNNRMELTAMIAGLEMLDAGDTATVHSDSSLVVNTLTKWAAGWEKRGWKRKEGEVKNLELVQRAYALLQERPGVRVEWVRAHDGTRWNEYADALSTAYLRGE